MLELLVVTVILVAVIDNRNKRMILRGIIIGIIV